jgi:hypothetical protein
LLWVSTLLVGIATLILPYLPGLGSLFGFVALPPWMMALLLAITLLYVIANEIAKRIFYQRVRF